MTPRERTVAGGAQRIAVFLPSLSAGGAELMTLVLCREFIHLGCQVDIIVARRENDLAHAVPNGARVLRLNARRTLYSLFGLLRYVIREQPAAVMSVMGHGNFVAALAKAIWPLTRWTLVSSYRSPVMESARMSRSWRQRAGPLAARFVTLVSDRVVGISRGVTSELQDLSPHHASKFVTIYNPAYRPEIHQMAREEPEAGWPFESDAIVVTVVGRLAPEKGQRLLIRSAQALMEKDARYRFLFVGDGPIRHDLEGLALSYGVPATFVGYCRNPYSYIQRSDVLVLTSRREGLGNVLVEAAALGTPFVSTDCPTGPREIVEALGWGTLIPVDGTNELVKAVESVRTAEEKPPSVSRAALEQFSPRHVASQYLREAGVPLSRA